MDDARARKIQIGVAVVVVVAVIVWVAMPARRVENAPADAAAPTSAPVEAGGLASPIPNAQKTYRTVEPQMRACFAEQQARGPAAGGKATFSVNVGTDGRVEAVRAEEYSSYDETTITCMANVIRSLRFDPPLDGQPVTIRIPVNFLASRGEGVQGDRGPPR